MQKPESIKLSDGTELIPLEAEEKEALEAEIKTALDKYGALYLTDIKRFPCKIKDTVSLKAELLSFIKK